MAARTGSLPLKATYLKDKEALESREAEADYKEGCPM
jgi:hypothetical protein